jgi:hypothetical protein
MTSGPSPAVGPPSRSGVRRGGDAFQDLIVLSAALTLLRSHRGLTRLDIEAKGVGALDDVVLRAADGPDLFGQVKWATNPADLLNETFLLAASGTGSSILAKLYQGWGKVNTGGHQPLLRLVTNRALDPTDPLLGHVDGRTGLLVPYAADAGPGSAAAGAVTRWAEHLGGTREELLAMLARLRFETGRSVHSERENARVLLDANGYDDSDAALDAALTAVARWVVDGRRELTATDIAETLDALGLTRREPSAILSVQAVDTEPHAGDADIALDWTALYDGDSPRARVVPRDPSAWATMANDLDDAAAAIEQLGFHSTIVRGAARLATLFRIGIALPQTRQHELIWRQGQQSWTTSATKIAAPIEVQTHSLQHDTPVAANAAGLVIAVGISTDPTAEVLNYVAGSAIPATAALTITPASGTDDQSVANAGQAVALAEAIRNTARAALIAYSTRTVHLFLAGPGGLALLLGHRWNKVGPTVVYEHRGAGRGYVPAFSIDA